MSGPAIRVLTADLGAATGWDPVTIAARVLARLLRAELVAVPARRQGAGWQRVAAALPRRRGAEVTIIVAPQPVHLYALIEVAHWLPGSSLVAGWVIDAFWTERIPRLVRHTGHIDQLFVTDEEGVATWSAATGVPTVWMPLGADVLGRACPQAARGVDLQRIGRQPAPWDDDAVNEARCRSLGLSYAGRPAFVPEVDGNQRSVEAAMANARFTLSFTNAASPAEYTHPTREYLTGRWTDALAQGATVAGIAPRCAATDRLLWPEAVLELGTTDPAEGLALIGEAVRAWTPERAAYNHRQALARLDWRWRFAEMVAALGLAAPLLDEELGQLESRLDALG